MLLEELKYGVWYRQIYILNEFSFCETTNTRCFIRGRALIKMQPKCEVFIS